MSGTRRAKSDSVFHQNRFASSAEFERGLLANLVAKRCALIEDKTQREIIWFVHYLSHQQGGIPALAANLIKMFPQHIEEEGLTFKQITSAQANFPTVLENGIASLCLDPASDLKEGWWGFKRIIPALKEYKAQYIKSKIRGFTTELGSKVSGVMDYIAYSGGLALMTGEARTGKSFAARAWCEQQPGRSRFVEVPPSNDEGGFFRALARALGLGNFLSYKARDIRDRVESVLLTKDLILVMDEAQRLWPQRNLRYGFPSRITWVMSMANAGVPIVMISTPQFIETQRAVEKSGWNGAQLTGRITHYEPLPGELSNADLIGVAKSILPEAEAKVLRALATYAQTSARYLAAIDSISKRAHYLAAQARHEKVTTEDVKKAMKESVIPADSKLTQALEAGAHSKRTRLSLMPAPASVENTGRIRAAFSTSREQIMTPSHGRNLEPALISG